MNGGSQTIQLAKPRLQGYNRIEDFVIDFPRLLKASISIPAALTVYTHTMTYTHSTDTDYDLI